LLDAGLQLKNVKMNGGAASYVLSNDEFVFNDLDMIFPMDLDDQRGDFESVRNAVFQVLLEIMPDDAPNVCPDVLRDIYIRKMVKVSDSDRWSLFSFG
jgi:hypothetical protein